KELVAYIVSKEALNSTDIRTYISSTLPAYMLPNYFVQLEELPLTPNGKIDKKALPDPEKLGMPSGIEYVAPRNEIEDKLVLIWQEILGKEKISIKDNFFELGGHSLKATRLTSQIHKQFEVKIALKELFQKPMLEEQAQLIQQAQKTSFITIPLAAEQTSYSLSSAQRRLWILSQFEEGNIAYNMPGVYVFEGDLDKPALEQAFTTLIERHEILRTIFKEDAQGQVRQWIQTVEDIGFKITYKDVRKEKKQAEKIRKIVQAECIKPFNLVAGPLLRANLYQIANDKWIFTYTMHHIISDGWSMNILIKELLLFYNAQTKGEANALNPLRIQYKDYASWQQEQLIGEQLQSHKTYWLEQFTGELPVLEMPTDKPRPAVKTYNGSSVHKTINVKLSKGLKTLSQEQGATLFMGLLAVVNTLLYRYTNQEDIIIGSPIAGREHADLEDQIGFYINTLALRTQFKGEDSYKELLEKVKQVILGAYEHQVYPFDELVDELQLNRDMSRSALFDVMVVLQNNNTSKVEGLHLGAIEVKEYSEAESQVSKFDLVFNFVEVEEALQVSIEYNSDIYNKNSIEQLASHLEQLLTVIVEQPATSINQLDYLSDKEKHQLLVEFNDTEVDYPKDKT
ncbi:MAG TPA: condensation domain-containing protein, partial [Chitinophagaceae bacterium]|nr:condensation domain-containing protein [Chitinophagaceae bacterium]